MDQCWSCIMTHELIQISATSSFKSQTRQQRKRKKKKTIVDFYCLFFKNFPAEETKGTMHLIYVYDIWKWHLNGYLCLEDL